MSRAMAGLGREMCGVIPNFMPSFKSRSELPASYLQAMDDELESSQDEENVFLPENVAELLRDGISLVLLDNFVLTTRYGHTFSNHVLLQLIDSKPVCPMTRQPLTHSDVVMNETVGLMMRSLRERRRLGPDREPLVDSNRDTNANDDPECLNKTLTSAITRTAQLRDAIAAQRGELTAAQADLKRETGRVQQLRGSIRASEARQRDYAARRAEAENALIAMAPDAAEEGLTQRRADAAHLVASRGRPIADLYRVAGEEVRVAVHNLRTAAVKAGVTDGDLPLDFTAAGPGVRVKAELRRGPPKRAGRGRGNPFARKS